jgi:hypothetical protein
MNHFEFMQIDHHVDFSIFKLFCWTHIPNTCHPYHFHLLCRYASNGVNDGLQVFIFLYACVSIMQDDPNAPKLMLNTYKILS